MTQPNQSSPRPRPNSLYTQLAIHTIGNALAIALGLIVWNLWAVLSDFSSPMLYALLCSIALRGPKDWLVKHFDARLSQDRSVAWALLSVLVLPLTALKETYEEARDLLLKWRQYVIEYQQELHKRQLMRRASSIAMPTSPKSPHLASPTSPRSPVSCQPVPDGTMGPAAAAAATKAGRSPSPSPAPPPTTLPVLLSVYAKAGVKALRGRRTSKKKRRKAARRAPVPSAVLFRWLFRTIVAWLVYEWVRAVWSATVQLVVLVTTLVLAVGSVPLLYLSAHWYLGATVFSPSKTPLGGLSTQGRGPQTPKTDRSNVTPLRRPRFTPASRGSLREELPLPLPTNGRADRSSSRDAPCGGSSSSSAEPGRSPARAKARAARAWWGAACGALSSAAGGCRGLLRVLDGALRALLRRNLHALVSLLLIAGLLLGSTGLAAFLTIQVAQEGRSSLLAVRDVFPAAWAGVVITTPMLADAVPAVVPDSAGAAAPPANVSCGGGSSSGGGSSGAGGGGGLHGVCTAEVLSAACGVGPALQCSDGPAAATAAAGGARHSPARALPGWLASYQQDAQGLIHRSLPAVAAWVDGQFGRFMDRHNLTAAAKDLRLLYEMVQGPRRCSAKERGQLLVAAARADLGLREALQQEKEAYSRAERLKLRLTSAVQQLGRLRSAAPDQFHEPPSGLLEGAAPHAAGAQGAAATAAAAGAARGSAAGAEDQQQAAALGATNSRSLQQQGLQEQKPAAAAGAAAGDGRGEAGQLAAGGTARAAAGSAADPPSSASPSLTQTSALPPFPIARMVAVQQEVVAADAELSVATAAHKAALETVAAAQREATAAEGRLQLCRSEGDPGSEGEGQGGRHVLLPGLAGDLGRRLQTAYRHLWHRQLREGWAEMRGAAALCLDALRNATSLPGSAGGPSHPHHHHHSQAADGGTAPPSPGPVADLGSLQRLLLAAADPLITAGRALAAVFALSVGSTTAAAVMGGLGVLRLGLGVAKFGMQLTLFLALLFYLLAAQREPLVHAVGVLPLSEGGRQRAAAALNKALGGVFISSVKLVAFHSAFTWLTFRMFGLPLAYTATVLCAACALLPFIPTYVVALPPCIALAAQGQLVSGLLFLGLHFLAYYLGDTLILEDIPGGHPYLMSLGILGGIWTFDNPLQGCLLGPILLSLLSVFYSLHSEFMSSGKEVGDQGPSWNSSGRKHHVPRVIISSPPAGSPSLSPAPSAMATPFAAMATPAEAREGQGERAGGTPRSHAGPDVGTGRGRAHTQQPPGRRQQQEQHGGQQGSAARQESLDGEQPLQSISLSLGGLRRRGGSRQSLQESGSEVGGAERQQQQQWQRREQENGVEEGEGETAESSPKPPQQQQQRYALLADDFSFGTNDFAGL